MRPKYTSVYPQKVGQQVGTYANRINIAKDTFSHISRKADSMDRYDKNSIIN